MATYTVLQDIEAEDKLLGPLTLRQFIYAGIMIGAGFIAFMAGKVSIFLAIPFLPIMFIFGFLAAPWGKDQPTETWAVAKVRYFFKPRKRIWDQTGQSDLVEITVPKKEIVAYTDGLSQHEVHSRLQVLASTIDSRGWAIKNTSYGQIGQPVVFGSSTTDSDRLTGAPTLPQAVPEYAAEPIYDVLDEQNSQVSQQINQMMNASEQAHRQQIIDRLNTPSVEAGPVQQPQQPWFVSGTNDSNADTTMPTADEQALLQSLHQQEELESKLTKSHLKTIQPIDPNAPQASSAEPSMSARTVAPQNVAQPQPKTAMTPASDPAILELAHNDDLDVATIARQAHKKSQDEVVISLH